MTKVSSQWVYCVYFGMPKDTSWAEAMSSSEENQACGASHYEVMKLCKARNFLFVDNFWNLFWSILVHSERIFAWVLLLPNQYCQHANKELWSLFCGSSFSLWKAVNLHDFYYSIAWFCIIKPTSYHVLLEPSFLLLNRVCCFKKQNLCSQNFYSSTMLHHVLWQ